MAISQTLAAHRDEQVREAWTTPVLRALDASASEFTPNVNADAEGHS